MLTEESARELRKSWLPNITDQGLTRLIELLEKGSPLLIHGSFTRALPMGCLATHAGWNHPCTQHCTLDAGINWLHRIAGLNPATSLVIREWDLAGSNNFEIRTDLAAHFREELKRRQEKAPVHRTARDLVTV